jgi:hypothetical protein
MGQAFGDASVADNDWLGTAALDNPVHQPLEEILGLDPTDWAIVGLDLTGGSRESSLAVLAVQRALLNAGGEDPALVARPDGTLPVTRFVMPAATGIELLRRFSRWSIHAQRPVGGAAVRLNVEDTVELPYPESRYGL